MEIKNDRQDGPVLGADFRKAVDQKRAEFPKWDVTAGDSETQKLLEDGYSLAQIALEFHIALAEVESGAGAGLITTAA